MCVLPLYLSFVCGAPKESRGVIKGLGSALLESLALLENTKA